MSSATNAHTLIRDLVQDVQATEPATKRKANTVTAVVGTVLTALAAGGAHLLESGLDLPGWVPFVVMLIGLVATDLGVSRTTNGMTGSVADRLELELARRIDLNHDHATVAELPAPATGVDELRAAADELAHRAE